MTTDVDQHSERTAFFNAAAQQWNEHPDCAKKKYLVRILQQQFQYAHHGDSFLDIGCGTGILFPFLQEFIVTAIDLSPAMVIRAQSQKAANVKEVLVADAHALPFADGHFNHAVMLAVFPHLHSQEAALREIHRVLKNNGTLTIIHTESRHIVNSIHASIGGAVGNDMLPELEEMLSLLQAAGFSILHTETQTGFSFIVQKE